MKSLDNPLLIDEPTDYVWVYNFRNKVHLVFDLVNHQAVCGQIEDYDTDGTSFNRATPIGFVMPYTHKVGRCFYCEKIYERTDGLRKLDDKLSMVLLANTEI